MRKVGANVSNSRGAVFANKILRTERAMLGREKHDAKGMKEKFTLAKNIPQKK